MMMFRLWQNALLDKVRRDNLRAGLGWEGGGGCGQEHHIWLKNQVGTANTRVQAEQARDCRCNSLFFAEDSTLYTHSRCHSAEEWNQGLRREFFGSLWFHSEAALRKAVQKAAEIISLCRQSSQPVRAPELWRCRQDRK